MGINFLRYFFIPFSFVYYLATLLRNFLYDKRIFKIRELPARVISVGNITWGGTGKTPTVIFIAGFFSGKGIKTTVLTRGYGRDESRIISRSVPVLSGPDRFKNGIKAVKKHDVRGVILDDGFQHRKLDRDLDIVCIDSSRPFGNGLLIPAGCLREGLYALKRADIFLLTKTDLRENEDGTGRLEEILKKINPEALRVKSVHETSFMQGLLDDREIDAGILRKKKIALVTAIGDPVSFEKTALKAGLGYEKHFVFRDHYWYKDKDLNRIERYCLNNNVDFVVTTEKDAVRLESVPGIKSFAPAIAVLRIKLRIIENEQRFYNRLIGLFNA